MKRFIFYIICILCLASCSNDMRNDKSKTPVTYETEAKIDINSAYILLVEQKLKDSWDTQQLHKDNINFKNLIRSEISLRDSIREIRFIDNIPQLKQDTLQLKTEIFYHNTKRDTIITYIISKEITIDNEVLKSLEVGFEN